MTDTFVPPYHNPETNELTKKVSSFRENLFPYERMTVIQRDLSTLMCRDNAASEGAVMVLIGRPGSGKTRLISDFSRFYKTEPKAVVERNGDIADRKPIVMTAVKETGLKSLARDTFQQFTGVRNSTKRRDDLLKDIVAYAKACETRLFIFDEVHQAYSNRTETGVRAVANMFKDLSNEAKFSLLLVGTEEAERVVEASPELQRRVVGYHHLHGFDWSQKSERDDFRSILKMIDDSLSEVFGELSGLAEMKMAATICKLSEGLVGLAAQLIERAGKEAVFDRGTATVRRITNEHFVAAHRALRWKGNAAEAFADTQTQVADIKDVKLKLPQGNRRARRDVLLRL